MTDKARVKRERTENEQRGNKKSCVQKLYKSVLYSYQKQPFFSKSSCGAQNQELIIKATKSRVCCLIYNTLILPQTKIKLSYGTTIKTSC